MTRPALRSLPGGPARLHCCSVCGRWDVWSEDWSWYGSRRDEDERHDRLVKTCSAVCQYDAKQAGHNGPAGLSGPYRPTP